MFIIVCHSIMNFIFWYLVQYIIYCDYKNITIFEYKVNEYIVGFEFNILYEIQLPLCIRKNRIDAIILVETLIGMLEKWIVDAIIKMSFAQKEDVTATIITTLFDQKRNKLIHS